MTNPADIPGLPPFDPAVYGRNGGKPQRMQIQVPPIAVIAAPQGQQEPPLGPIATSVSLDRLQMSDGQWLVALRLATPLGVQIHWFHPDTAIQIGGFFIQHGRAAKAGITGPMPPYADDAGPVIEVDCPAELRVRHDGDEWTVHPCSNKEPNHPAHKADVPGHPVLNGFRWGKAIETDDYVATVPPEE